MFGEFVSALPPPAAWKCLQFSLFLQERGGDVAVVCLFVVAALIKVARCVFEYFINKHQAEIQHYEAVTFLIEYDKRK